ncbi:autophagy protein 5 [Microbotryomycetes sp. JL201]|nr:autophagy protein 5 [Microbotryomycetes sp. JL201]
MQETFAPVPASLFRSLVFGAHVTLKIQIAQDELPSHADKAIESYYMQARRISYLPLLLPHLRKNFLAAVLDGISLNALNDESIWFSYQGSPLKWHWPIGLLYDLHFLPRKEQKLYPLQQSDPVFTITLHVKDPPSDVLLLNPSLEACQSSFMNMLKESDYTRYGSTKRVVNLRREQQDAIWEGVVQGEFQAPLSDFEKYWNVASKLITLPSPLPPPASPNLTTLQPSPPTTRSPSPSGFDSVKLRSVPVRIYLPYGAPVMQDLAPPYTKEGSALTLKEHLSSVVSLLFPPNSASVAKTIVQGIEVPPETEIGWLGSCLTGADGWVSVVVAID